MEAQSYRNFELIVVDNASTDSSLALLESRFPQARLIRNTGNEGFCAANNQGFAAARGEYFVLLNNDAVADPRWLEELVRTAEAHPRAGMVASKIYVHGTAKTIDKIGHLIYFDGQNRGRGSGETDCGQYDTPGEVLWPDGCAALFRREMIEEAGGFDEDFFAYADDAELGMRGRLLGWEAVLAPASLVYHHRGATLGKYSNARIHLIERNRLWLAVLHFPLWLLLLNPFYFAVRLLASFFASTRDRGEAAHYRGFRAKIELGLTLLRADFAAISGLTRMWSKRRAFRQRRKLDDRELMNILRRHAISLRELTHNRA